MPVTVGLRCDNSDCPVGFHDGCVERLWRVNKSRKCPSCGGEYGAAKGMRERTEVRRGIGRR